MGLETENLPIKFTRQGTESSLIDRLQKLLEAETLDGDNQYHCSRCDKLRDAQRSVQIDSVPPTLNFSLLRFVFDPKTFDRKKSRTLIKFPSRINMRPYMSDNAGKDTWYELKGVIEHRGTSVSCPALSTHFGLKAHGHSFRRITAISWLKFTTASELTGARSEGLSAYSNRLFTQSKAMDPM